MRNIGRRFIPGIRIEVKEDEPEEKVGPANSVGGILDKISGIRVTTQEIQRDSDDITVSDFASTNGKVDDEDVDDNVDSNGVTFNGSNDDADVNESFVIPTSTSTNFIWLTRDFT